MSSALNIQTSRSTCPGDMLPCGLPGALAGGAQGFGDYCQLQTPCFDVHEPGSPQVADLRCTGSLGSRMQADVRMLSGSKRSCEGHSSLQDEAEADDASMISCRGSDMMCRSGSVRSFGIKRVCSMASADGLDSYCPTAYQQQQTSVMIPVPGSTSSLQQPLAGSPATAGPAKRSSKTGSSSISSQDLNGTATAAQEVASAAGAAAAMSSGRKLAPIRTSVAPRVPRMRLNGRLLSPEEAQKHLAAVAAAAAAATASRSLSRAQSPAVTCPGTSSPAGPYSSSMSLSAGNAPCNSAGNSSGMCWTTSKLAPTAAGSKAAAAVQAGQAMYAAAAVPGTVLGGSRVLSALDVLPENFIPTPEGNWHTLASTLEDGCCAATSGGCPSPLVCSSYTELLMTEEASTAALPPAAAREGASFTAPKPFRGLQGTAAMLAQPTANTADSAGVSAFAAPSAVPWGIQQQPGAGHTLMLPSAGSVSDPASLDLSTSCPVRIPMHSGGSWNSSKLLTGSISGSSGNSTLATSLAHQGSNAATDTECTDLLGAWGLPQDLQQQQVHVQQQGLVTFGSLASGSIAGSNGGFVPSAAWGTTSSAPAAVGAAAGRPAAVGAWKPAFVPAFTPADALASGGSSTAGAAVVSTSMVPTPGLAAVGSAPALSTLLQQQRAPTHRAKGTPSRAKKQGKAPTGSKGTSHGPVLQLSASAAQPGQLPGAVLLQQQQQVALQAQQMVAVLDGGQQVVLSQQDLMAVLQQNMAASFASGYMMASSMQGNAPGGPTQVQLQPQPPLLKPVAALGAFVMPPAAVTGGQEAPVVTAGVLGGALGSSGGLAARSGTVAAAGELQTTAAAVAALGSSSDMSGLVVTHGVDDILPSLQELLTDCC